MINSVLKYFILFDAIISSFLNLLLDCSLSLYSKTTEVFCVNLVFYNFIEFISSNSFLMDSLGFSVYRIMFYR